MEKVLQGLFGRPYCSNGTKLYVDAALTFDKLFL